MARYLTTGQKVTIKALRGLKVSTEAFRVHGIYRNFVVLENDKYRVSAFYKDIYDGTPIAIYS